MNKFAFRIIFLLGFILTAAMLVQAQGQLITRTWVSGVGDDVNPCSRTAPCKTFAAAIAKTAVNGEINCIDSGGFSPVIITKSITIDCTGNYASILAATSNTNGITINAAQSIVRLRGLSITGQNLGLNGILITSAGKVIIEDTVIDGFVNNGISLGNTYASALFVSNSTVRNNNGVGIYIAPFGTVAATGVVFNTRIIGNNAGINAQLSDVAVTNCLISANGTGINVSNGGIIRISGNTISENNTAMTIAGGGTAKPQIISYSNNALSGNSSAGSAPSSTQGLQ
jgi:hypothetical protein